MMFSPEVHQYSPVIVDYQSTMASLCDQLTSFCCHIIRGEIRYRVSVVSLWG